MGRRGSVFCLFIMKGLSSKKYRNLKMLSDNPIIFSLRLPGKTKNLDPADEKFLKDWRAFKGLSYDYSVSKQAVKALLKESNFFQGLNSETEDETVWRMLNEKEVIAKKERNPTSVGSSGYGSGCEEDVNEDVTPMTAPSPEQSQTLNRPSSSSDSYEELNILRHSNENNLCIDPNVIQIDSRNPILPRNPVTPCFEKICQDYLFNYESPNLLNIEDYFHDVDISSSANSFEELMKIDIQSLEMDTNTSIKP